MVDKCTTILLESPLVLTLAQSLRHRHQLPELMDDPNLDRQLHYQALQGLARVNWISGTVATLWSRIRHLAAARPQSTLHVLDVACGGGDTAIRLWQRAQRSGLPIRISGVDISRIAIDYATARAQAAQADIQFLRIDVIRDSLPDGIDIVYSSLFLHHLDAKDLIAVLSQMRESSARMILAIDLVRCPLGYALAWWGVRLLTRSGICHVDGPLSVRAAFTLTEMSDLVEQAGLEGSKLTRHWPERYLLTWIRP